MKDTRHIVYMMETTGREQRQAGIIATWKELVAQWAAKATGNPDAEAVKAWLPHWQTRPFYTAEELAPMWPALAIATGFTSKWLPTKSAKRLEHELDYCGLPRLPFRPEFFIVERWHHWRRATEAQIKQELENAQR